MIIHSDNLLEHLKERMETIALQCVGNRQSDIEQTQFDRGRYASYKELINYIQTNFSE